MNLELIKDIYKSAILELWKNTPCG